MSQTIQNFVASIKACEQASGPGSKDVIKRAIKGMDSTARELVRYAMDPYLVFGIKKFDRPEQYSSTDRPDALTFIKIVLEKLISRKLTGNAARAAATNLLAEFTPETAAYIARIIDKDLQAGFSADTFNKIWPNEPVPTFEVMLADKCTTDEEFEEISYPCLADIKYDGERNVAIVTETGGVYDVTHYSRSGKVAEHMVGLFDDELIKIRQHLGYDFILDGERMARTYIDTINAKKSGKEGAEARANMIFRAFFLMPLTDWQAQRTAITMVETREHIADVIAVLDLKKITLTDSVLVNSHTEMMKELDRVTTPGFQGMPKGQEGLILKVLSATYKWDRTADWCKVKKFYDADMRIDSWEFGRKKNAQRMGRVNGHGWLEDGTYFEVGVGSGWTDAQREDFVKNFEKNWKGKTLVVKYQEVSKGKDKAHASLRFPTVDQEKLLRDDKIVPEKP
jgi:DNA ligase-1